MSLALAREALAHGDVAAAERLCRAAVHNDPRHGHAWALLAETGLIRKRPDAAKACAERAVAFAPGDATARIMLAKVSLVFGDLIAALNTAQAALPLVCAPAEADALAGIFGLLGRHSQAHKLSTRAVCAEGGNAQFLFNLAATERMLGLLGDAEAHCNESIGCDPKYALSYYLRADLREQTLAQNHTLQLEQLIQTGSLAWREETALRYALAKEYEDLGDHERAFAEVATGAELWRKHVAYDAGAGLAEIQRAAETQNARWLASAVGSRRDDAPIFVCGLPRTGTTLIERIISSHSSVASVGETGVFAIEAARRLDGSTSSKADLQGLGAAYMGVVRHVFTPSQTRFVDKTLTNYLYCGLIHAALPKAKIILVERQPMDAAWSLYKAHFNGGFLYSYDLVELADYYLAYRRIVTHWETVLPTTAVLTVAYEDVVANQREQSLRILEFLGIPWEDSTLRFYESNSPSSTASAVQIRQPIYSTSVGKWRFHAKALVPFLQRLDIDSAVLSANGNLS